MKSLTNVGCAVLMLLGPGAWGADDRLVFEPGNGPSAAHIALVSGDEEYRSEEALTQLARILSTRHSFKCTVLFALDPKSGIINPRVRDNIPGLESLAKADLMILFIRWRDLPEEQMAHIDAYVQSGKPIIGMRTSTHAFAMPGKIHDQMRAWQRENNKRKRKDPNAKPTPRPTFSDESWGRFGHYGDGYDGSKENWAGGFGRAVLGEMWVSHHGHHKHESTRGVVNAKAAGHPILRGIKDGDIWGPTDVYTAAPPEGSVPLILGQVIQREGEFDANDLFFGMRPTDSIPVEGKNSPMMPVAWTRTFTPESGKSSRVFTTTMGASTDLLTEGMRRLLVNAVYWCLEKEKEIPKTGTNVDTIGSYDPSGFGSHQEEYWEKHKLKPSAFR